MPDPILIGRNAEKIEALAKAHGIARFGTNLDAALDDKTDTVFFDAGTTQMRPTLLARALRAGKHVYCEKPIATNLAEAVQICQQAQVRQRRCSRRGSFIRSARCWKCTRGLPMNTSPGTRPSIQARAW